MAKGKENAVTKVDPTSKEVAAPMQRPAGMPHIGKQDFVAAKILVQQDTSDKVKTQEAKRGEFRDTIANTIFGSSQHPFEVIPLAGTNFCVEYDVTSNPQGKYLGQYAVNAQNEGQAREEMKDGKKIKRVQTIEIFCLIPQEVKDGGSFPYVLSFRMTSLRAGRILLNQMYIRNFEAGKPPYGNVCEISAKEESNDKGDYFVQNVKPKRASTPEEEAKAAYWANLIGAGQVQKDDSDLQTGGEERMVNTNTNQF